MIRLLFILVFALASLPAHAGFKMYGPGGQYMNSTGGSQPARSEVQFSPQDAYQQSGRPAKIIRNDPADNVDMSGVEWRQTRGSYSGRGDQMTKPFGYRAGNYCLKFNYRGGTNFIVWMYTRKGQKDLLVNIIGGHKGQACLRLEHDDEVFFVVDTGGNWDMTFERRN